MKKLSIIVAIAANGAIGKDNDLIWRLPNDLKRFKQLTTGHTIVMGRKTFESLPKGALPNRVNIVISRNKDFAPANCIVVGSPKEALEHCKNEKEAFVIGGSSIYKHFLEHAQKLYITQVHHSFSADTFFPKIEYANWKLSKKEDHKADPKHAYAYSFLTYEKKDE